jgi:hydroxyethylthiazole kinase-like uncharacterized protein yjeF
MNASIKTLSLEEGLKSLPIRHKNAHKGDFGHVLIIGGDYGMGGAVRLAGEAALRAGAGTVSIATRPEHAFAIMGNCPELMCHGIEYARDLNPLLKQATAVVLGPGLGQSDWGQALFKHTFFIEQPLIVDADGLNLLIPYTLKRNNWILTPHPGEAARLLDKTVEDIQKDRVNAIYTLQNRYEGIVVLKGAGSLVLGTGEARICLAGNPGMATAGMGDVLSGIIGAFVAEGLALEEAASLGVSVHAAAGDKLALNGNRGIKASDLFETIRECLNQ